MVTQWKEFAVVDFAELKKRMYSPLIFDGRNLLDPGIARISGFR